jgi:hypothetical protein
MHSRKNPENTKIKQHPTTCGAELALVGNKTQVSTYSTNVPWHAYAQAWLSLLTHAKGIPGPSRNEQVFLLRSPQKRITTADIFTQVISTAQTVTYVIHGFRKRSDLANSVFQLTVTNAKYITANNVVLKMLLCKGKLNLSSGRRVRLLADKLGETIGLLKY